MCVPSCLRYTKKMVQKDYYRILGVNETSGADEIKKSYRSLAFQHHPDRTAGCEEMMKAVNEAYAVLSNPAKRAEYDSLRQRYGPSATDYFRRHHSEQDIFRGSDINQVFEEISKAFGLSSPQDVFSRGGFYGQNYRTFEFKSGGGAGKGFFFFGQLGGTHQEGLKMPSSRTQQAAGIKQRIASKIVRKILTQFQKALAKKFGIKLPEHGRDLHDHLRITLKQAEAGGKIRYRHTKQGDPRDLDVMIPQRIRDGQKIRLKGLGEPGKHGGETGSLYLKVKVRKTFPELVKSLIRK
jgi:curved DNA-binding protein CbpA